MEVGVILLAGGKSSRMGADKGLLLVNKKPMIASIIDTVSSISNNIIIVSNKNEYQQFGFPVVEDLIKNAGPLAGIYTGLRYSKAEKNIVLSCDVPFVSGALLRFLIKKSSNVDVTIVKKNNRIHPLIGVYTKNCLPIFEEELTHQQLKVRLALQKVNLNTVNATKFDEHNFININTPTDLKFAKNEP